MQIQRQPQPQQVAQVVAPCHSVVRVVMNAPSAEYSARSKFSPVNGTALEPNVLEAQGAMSARTYNEVPAGN